MENRIALIDGDSIPYKLGYVAEKNNMPFGQVVILLEGMLTTIKIDTNSDEYIIESIGPGKPVKTYNEELIDTDCIYIKTDGHPHLFDFKNVNIPVVNKRSQSVYNKEVSKLVYLAKSERISKTKNFKWKLYFDFEKQWGSIYYGYCYTGHKIQGSGYKNIYVDVNDILTVSMISDKRKLQSLYTAITRATDLVILIRK